MQSEREINALVESIKSEGILEEIDFERYHIFSMVTHSTAIEGSTMTEMENQMLFEEGISPSGHSITEQNMNLDLKEAYEYAFNLAKKGFTFSEELLMGLAAKAMRRTGEVYNTMLGSFDTARGEYRKVNVSAGYGGRSYLSFQKVPQAMRDFVRWANERRKMTDPGNASQCYDFSFEAHYYLVTIHPWADGNGRTSRLVMNLIQKQYDLIPTIVPKEKKEEYIRALIDAREEGSTEIFVSFMRSLLKEQLEGLLKQHNLSMGAEIKFERKKQKQGRRRGD